MATIFQEPGTDATFGFQFWTSATGGVTSDTAQVNTGPRSIKCDSGAGNTVPIISRINTLADAGRRISFYIRFIDFPSSTIPIYNEHPPAGNVGFTLEITSGGILQVWDGRPDATKAQIGSNGSTLSTGTWYRICISYTITNSTTNEIRIYLNGTLDISITNGANIGTDRTTLHLGWGAAPGANKVFNIDDIYVDDSSALTDTGNIRVTAKLPNAENVNNFDTAIGNARGASDFNNINERALSETNGWRHNANTSVSENYGIEGASSGDVDLTGVTLVARTAWIWSKRDNPGSIGFVNSATAQSKTNETTLNITVPTGGWAVNSSVIIVASIDSSLNQFVSTITDTAGNTYVNDSTADNTNNVRTEVWSSHDIVALAAGNTITITWNVAADAKAAIAANFTGLVPTSTEDFSQTNTGTDTSPQVNNTTQNTAQADELIIGGYGGEGPNGDIWGDPTTLSDENIIAKIGTTGGQAVSNITSFMLYRIVSSIAQWDTDASIDVSRDWAANLVCYKGSTPNPKITNNGTDTNITLTTTSTLFTNIVDSTTYPSNAATIGMVSTGSIADTFLYECGILISYIPAAAAAVLNSFKNLLGVGL